MQLHVSQADWGVARLNDIEALLKDTASHLNQLLRTPFEGLIHVEPTPPNQPCRPRTLYRTSHDAPFVIWLSARDRKWAKFSYQFSHEFCHVLSNYEKLKDNPNNWFHEAICELASVFTLRRMAERWPTHPPYPNWADYAAALKDYSQEWLSRQKAQLSKGVALRSWLSSHEQSLRLDKYQRQKNAVVAYVLLPIFESTPEGWNAIQSFPTSSGSLMEYLLDWYTSVDPDDQNFVARILKVFDYAIST